MTWIPISERAPESDGRYFYVDDEDEPAVAEFMVGRVWFDRARDTTVYPIWWMPIPAVPWDET